MPFIIKTAINLSGAYSPALQEGCLGINPIDLSLHGEHENLFSSMLSLYRNLTKNIFQGDDDLQPQIVVCLCQTTIIHSILAFDHIFDDANYNLIL